MDGSVAFATWHLPLSRDDATLRAGAADMARVGAAPDEIPLLVRLAENPKFDLFHGAVDLATHDYIHMLLGRGLLSKDEAFVLGFTMGSTHSLGAFEEGLFSLVARRLYPGVYRFSAEDEAVFHDAVKLGSLCDCPALNEIDFTPHLDKPLGEVRASLGIATDLLRAYFRIEKARYPDAPESQRLLD
jgi:hypothetical protein